MNSGSCYSVFTYKTVSVQSAAYLGRGGGGCQGSFVQRRCSTYKIPDAITFVIVSRLTWLPANRNLRRLPCFLLSHPLSIWYLNKYTQYIIYILHQPRLPLGLPVYNVDRHVLGSSLAHVRALSPSPQWSMTGLIKGLVGLCVQPCLGDWACKRIPAAYRKRAGHRVPVVDFPRVLFIK